MEDLRDEKNNCFFIITTIFTTVSANAAIVPRESIPCNATEESVIIAENLISGILDNVQNGLGFADARNRSNAIIFNAVISHQTNEFGYATLTEISNNAIFQYRDMYLRPQFYAENEEWVQNLISDIIESKSTGKIDYKSAEKAAYIRIYQSINPAFDYDYQMSIDSCYRDIPSVDGAIFTIVRRLLLNA